MSAHRSPDRGDGLRRQLGLPAVTAVVMGDMLGSGIFFTPGELAAVTAEPWQVYFIWTLCGLIVLAGALTLGELSAHLPRAGASFHIIQEAHGPLWGFLKIWIEICVSAPGSIAGVAIVFGTFVHRLLGTGEQAVPVAAIAAIAAFAGINLAGVRWGGRLQVALTSVKILGVLALVGGSFLLAEAAAPVADAGGDAQSAGLFGLLRFVGLGVAAVLFTYDGWTDVAHVAGEVDEPKCSLPRGLGGGVVGILVLYLIVNHAFLRVLPLPLMREEGATAGTALAVATFGPVGGQIVSALIMISIFGALGGLVMTAPRLVYAPAEEYARLTRGRAGHRLFHLLSYVSPRTGVPSAAIAFSALLASLGILFFGTFDRLVAFIVVPLQFTNILLVGAVFRLRRRTRRVPGAYLAPGYPFVPFVFVVVMAALLASAVVFNPLDTLIGAGITLAGVPVYAWIRRGSGTEGSSS